MEILPTLHEEYYIWFILWIWCGEKLILKFLHFHCGSLCYYVSIFIVDHFAIVDHWYYVSISIVDHFDIISLVQNQIW